MSSVERWERRYTRERQAREQAESILEQRSRELYAANRELEAAKASLEERVQHRTAALEKAVESLRVEAEKRLAVQQKLREARDAALELADVKTEFLARMSHEIRTPLNAIIGLTGVLLDSPIDDKQQKHLETVRTSGQMLLRIINDILDMSKIEAGKLDLEYEPVDLTTVLNQAFSLFILDASAKGIEILQKNQALLPSNIVTDGGRVQQVVTNLLSNAIKYSDGGTVTAGIKMRPQSDDNIPSALRNEYPHAAGFWQQVEISVSDQGRGISAADIDELFQPFTRVTHGTDENASSSSGLGLAICRRLTEMMGGSIDVVSEEGVGSTFTVSLPAWLPHEGEYENNDDIETTNISMLHQSRDHLLASHENQARLEQYLSMAQDKPLSVLLADDYDVNRMVLQSQLESLGYRADAVANGEEVLRALHARDYDVVLMDIRMPVIDGVEATQRIRSRIDGPQPYIVAVTASALEGDRERYLEAGMDGYLAKPVDIVELGAALESAYSHCHDGEAPPWTGNLVEMNPVEIDLADLRERLGPGLDSLLAKVVPVYLRELPGRLEHLADALTNGDTETFARYCHGLKGTSKSVGAVELAERCSQYEEAGYRNELPSRDELAELEDLANRTAVALKNTLRESAASQ
ncbi:MAG: response regulator [Pseudomonadota bacterium]